MGDFGPEIREPYLFIPLAIVFAAGLFDFRRPWRIAHLDLAVLLSFGIAMGFWHDFRPDIAVPLAYPPLAYLLARMLWIGFRGRSETDGLRPSAPVGWLAGGLIFLVFFRIALNLGTGGVIDVSYSGVIGADRVTHGETVWGKGEFPSDNDFGDAYGPVNYYAYVPFELALPWDSGYFDDELPAARGAAIFFDLFAVLGLYVLGRRLGRRGDDPEPDAGRALGVTLGFAWCAYPFTTYALQSSSNDALMAALIIWAFVALASPVGRGIWLGVGTMMKFVPAALAPLLAAGERSLLDRRQWRQALIFTIAFAVTVALLAVHPALDPGIGTFLDRTLGNQLDRSSQLSIWGREPSLDWLQKTLQVGTVVLGFLVAFVPRRRSPVQLAALGAAVLLAVEIAASHWFYLYLPWFLGLMMVALLATTVSPAASGARAAHGHRNTESAAG